MRTCKEHVRVQMVHAICAGVHMYGPIYGSSYKPTCARNMCCCTKHVHVCTCACTSCTCARVRAHRARVKVKSTGHVVLGHVM